MVIWHDKWYFLGITGPGALLVFGILWFEPVEYNRLQSLFCPSGGELWPRPPKDRKGVDDARGCENVISEVFVLAKGLIHSHSESPEHDS